MSTSIVLDRDVRFTSRFWKKFHEDLGSWLHFNMAYHPQTDEQSKRRIQMLEDMLCEYVWISEEVGTLICHWLSFLTAIAIIRFLVCLPLSCYMGGDVGLRFVRERLGSELWVELR